MNSKKNILSIETSSNICGVSFISKGVCIETIEQDSKKKHAELLPDFYSRLKNTTGFILDDIDAIAISIGPGSFTGLRIGLSFAKGLAYSKNLPIIPISTMMSLAYSLKDSCPDKGIIYSHAKRVFFQDIKWQKEIPYPVGDIRVYEWNEVFEYINNVFCFWSKHFIGLSLHPIGNKSCNIKYVPLIKLLESKYFICTSVILILFRNSSKSSISL